MEKKYKIKPVARKFIKESLRSDVKTLWNWRANDVPEYLLDPVDRIYIEHGIKMPNRNATNLCGYDHANRTGHFEFTVRFSEMDYEEYNTRSKYLPELMDKIQHTINVYFDGK